MDNDFHATIRPRNESELWFSMSASLNVSISSSQQPNSHRISNSEQSAYRATSDRISLGATSPPRVPAGSTNSNLNKPLPLSPSEIEKKTRTRDSWRNLLHLEPSRNASSTHLRPEPYSARASSLSVNTQTPYQQSYSHSMPSSPFIQEEALPQSPSLLPRTQSSMADYTDVTLYQPYSTTSSQQPGMVPYSPQRSISMNTYFDPTMPSRARTFPDSTLSPTTRGSASSRPRPHTWLSPTEPFSDISQFHLFAEAMTGLSNDSDPLSPNGRPQLQGSLFARRSRNDAIPLPLQQPSTATAGRSTTNNIRDDWQNFEPPPSVSLSSHAASATHLPRPQPQQQWEPPPHMAAINRELELLGLDDDNRSDDELPNYAQSQAEANERRRAEASARARELEARWRGTRR